MSLSYGMLGGFVFNYCGLVAWDYGVHRVYSAFVVRGYGGHYTVHRLSVAMYVLYRVVVVG